MIIKAPLDKICLCIIKVVHLQIFLILRLPSYILRLVQPSRFNFPLRLASVDLRIEHAGHVLAHVEEVIHLGLYFSVVGRGWHYLVHADVKVLGLLKCGVVLGLGLEVYSLVWTKHWLKLCLMIGRHTLALRVRISFNLDFRISLQLFGIQF